MATELQIIFAIGASLGLAQMPISTAWHQPSGYCSEHEKAPHSPDKGLAGCHACTLPRPDDEDED